MDSTTTGNVIDLAANGSSTTSVEDVFSTYLYTGNGSTQNIENGVDLENNGGLVWLKHRDGSENHGLIDTERGGNSSLHTNTT